MAVQLALGLLTAFLRPRGAELPVPRGLRAPCPPAPALLLPRGLTHRCREHPSPGGMEMVQGWDGTEQVPPLSPVAHQEHHKAHPCHTRGTSHERRAQPAAMGSRMLSTHPHVAALPCPVPGPRALGTARPVLPCGIRWVRVQRCPALCCAGGGVGRD